MTKPQNLHPIDSNSNWTLKNETVQATLAFAGGSLRLESLYNCEANVEYMTGEDAPALFTHQVNGATIAANDGQWTLEGSALRDIELFDIHWGKRLEITLTRPTLSIRQVFELYNDRAGLRCLSYFKNVTEDEITITASELLNLGIPVKERTLYHVEGINSWKSTRENLTRGGRNCIVHYNDDHGLFVSPENNWATCLQPGPRQGLASEKMLYVEVNPDLRIVTNPKAVQLTLFPKEEIEYFSVDFGVFSGDAIDARVAAAEHFRKRFKFMPPMHQLAINDWQFAGDNDRSDDTVYHQHVIPKAAAAGFDRINLDDFWYFPEDSCEPYKNWTDMTDLCDTIVKAGMKPGHWFSLQGKWCGNGWAEGRDCADPANIDFKLKQMTDILIGQYQTRWDQVDAGLLWKTDEATPYSHPMDSVYRKILGMKRYMKTIADQYPDFLMQVTCEIDNPAGPAEIDADTNQNVGLIHLADNGIIGMFQRTAYRDDVRDLFACCGMFPLEGLLSTWGGDRIDAKSWQDSPLWYYQFLLARHTMIYSEPWKWSDASVQHMRAFNDWRKRPEISGLLNELMRPVYSGPDWIENKGPWAWMFTDAERSKALLIALNHRDLNPRNAFDAKLRWLDPGKTYCVKDITMLPSGKFNNEAIGTFSGKSLRETGLHVNLDEGPEACAAYWLEEASTSSSSKAAEL